MDLAEVKRIVTEEGLTPQLKTLRLELAGYSAGVFTDVGTQLHVSGHLLGDGRVTGRSAFGHGSDEVVGMSFLLLIAGQLVSASSELLSNGRSYAGAALLRQIVEVEYLAWAFDTRHEDALRWLQSDRAIREEFFKPAKLRQAAGGKFRGRDYGFHCELGGHPVPTGAVLLRNESSTVELLMSDLLGHVGGIWCSFIGWASRNESYTEGFKLLSVEFSQRFATWQREDPLVRLPPP